MPTKKKKDDIPSDIAALSFEEAYGALKDATERLENEEVDLESMLAEYERASALARRCASLLESAEKKIRMLIESEGEIRLGPLDVDEE